MEQPATIARLSIERFFTKYQPDPADKSKMLAIDYVTYGPFGMLDKSKITERVARLSCLETDEVSDNPVVMQSQWRWSQIKPRYEAWKAGRDIPINGTPLAAWNLLTPEDAEMFKLHKVYTVEDVAALTAVHYNKFPIPNLNALVEQARIFLASADRNRAAGELADLRSQNEALKAEMDEIRAALRRGPAAQPVEAEEGPKRRGRPPKQQEEPDITGDQEAA